MIIAPLQVVDGEAIGFLPSPSPEAPLFCRPDPGVSRADLDRMVRRLAEAGMDAAVHELGPYSAVIIDAPAEIDRAREALRRAVDEIEEAPPPAPPATPKPAASSGTCMVAYADMKRTVAAGMRCSASNTTWRLLAGTVRVRARDGRLAVSAYNPHDQLVSLAQCPAETDGEIDLIMPHSYLLEWLRAGVPGERLKLSHEQWDVSSNKGKPDLVDQLAIRAIKDSGRPAPEVNFNARTTEEYPEVSLPDGTEFRVSLPAKQFKLALKQALSCASTDSTRPRICSVAFELADRGLLLWSTDTHRLITVELDLPVDAPKLNIIVQTPGLKKMAAALPASGEVTLVFSESLFALEIGDVLLVAPTYTAGQMPNRHKVGAKPPTRVCMVLNREDFAAAAKKVGLMSRADNRKLVLTSDNRAGELRLSAGSTKLGQAEQTVAIEQPVNEDKRAAFNCDFLLQALTQLTGREVLLELVDENQPAHLVSDNVHVMIMPMFIG